MKSVILTNAVNLALQLRANGFGNKKPTNDEIAAALLMVYEEMEVPELSLKEAGAITTAYIHAVLRVISYTTTDEAEACREAVQTYTRGIRDKFKITSKFQAWMGRKTTPGTIMDELGQLWISGKPMLLEMGVPEQIVDDVKAIIADLPVFISICKATMPLELVDDFLVQVEANKVAAAELTMGVLGLSRAALKEDTSAQDTAEIINRFSSKVQQSTEELKGAVNETVEALRPKVAATVEGKEKIWTRRELEAVVNPLYDEHGVMDRTQYNLMPKNAQEAWDEAFLDLTMGNFVDDKAA